MCLMANSTPHVFLIVTTSFQSSRSLCKLPNLGMKYIFRIFINHKHVQKISLSQCRPKNLPQIVVVMEVLVHENLVVAFEICKWYPTGDKTKQFPEMLFGLYSYINICEKTSYIGDLLYIYHTCDLLQMRLRRLCLKCPLFLDMSVALLYFK